MPPPDYESVCKSVGQLFLESRHQVEQLVKQLEQVKRERDDALKLLKPKE